jgi:hypothetical protein
MRPSAVIGVIVVLMGGCFVAAEPPEAKPAAPEPPAPKAPELGEGWVSLFDGKSLEGWKAAERPASFVVRDGAIVTNGSRAHLFYVGDVEKHDFKDFEFRADVMTTPGANSGIYIHTKYQETDWPRQGYEIQVNQTHSDTKKTAGIYDVEDVTEAPAADNEWFSLEVTVRGKRVVTKVNGKTLIDYTEPENPQRPRGWEGRRLSSGTFALQCHDPGSTVYFANIMVKPLTDEVVPPQWRGWARPD